MSSFKDNAGREWFVKLNGLSVNTIRDKYDISLWDVLTVNRESLAKLRQSSELCMQVIWECIADQFVESNVSDDDFIAAIDGDVADAATEALVEAIASFSKAPERGAVKEFWKRLGMGHQMQLKAMQETWDDPKAKEWTEKILNQIKQSTVAEMTSTGDS